jgi:protein gp37
MAENSGIEWTDHTFNPWQGCSKVSPACKNCYAMELVNRYGGDFLGRRVVAADSGWKKPLKWNKQANLMVECDECRHRYILPEGMEESFCSKCGNPTADTVRPRVFCASLADVFEDWDGPIHNHKGEQLFWSHARMPHESRWHWITASHCAGNEEPVSMSDVRRRLFELIDATPNLDWLLLTKRPENIEKMWPTWPKGFPSDGSGGHGSGSRYLKNVWLGTTVENQEQADKRIPELLKCLDLSPVLFLSCEPLLGPVDLNQSWKLHRGDGFRLNRNQYHGECPTRGIDWVIVGGESGKDARPMHHVWAESLRDQCQAASVPFFFKQWGEWIPGTNFGRDEGNYNETDIGVFPESKYETHLWDEDDRQHEELVSVKVGKKRAGRLLDGKEHSQFPCTEASK